MISEISFTAEALRQRAQQVGPRIAAAEFDAMQASRASCDPDAWMYRQQTLVLLKRYFRISIEVGRLPSLLGREFFRARITKYSLRSFEDAVIFVHDIERSLQQLDDFERELIAKVVLQEYSQDEVAGIMGCWRRTVGRRFPETLDVVSEIFLESGLLPRLPGMGKKSPKSCQEAKNREIAVSDSI